MQDEKSERVEPSGELLDGVDEHEGYPTEKDLAGIDRRRVIWGYLAVLALTATLTMLVAIVFQTDELVSTYAGQLKWVQAVFLFFVLFTTLAVHKWSVLAISRLYLKVRDDRRKSPKDKDLLGNQPCYYCGYRIAPIVCAACGSIQWPSLVNEATGIKGPRSWWPTAAFIAHHRFKILAASMSALLVVFLPMMLDMQAKIRLELENVQDTKARVTAHMNSSLEAVTNFRAALLAYESACLPAEVLSEFCRERWTLVVEEYFRFSWSGPQTIHSIVNDHCSSPRAESTRLGPEHEQAVVLHNRACRLLTAFDTVDNLDTLFGKLVAESITDSASAARGQLRLLTAHNLYNSGRRLACAMLFAHYPESTLLGEPEDPRLGVELMSMQTCVIDLEGMDWQAIDEEYSRRRTGGARGQMAASAWLFNAESRDDLSGYWREFYDSRAEFSAVATTAN